MMMKCVLSLVGKMKVSMKPLKEIHGFDLTLTNFVSLGSIGGFDEVLSLDL